MQRVPLSSGETASSERSTWPSWAFPLNFPQSAMCENMFIGRALLRPLLPPSLPLPSSREAFLQVWGHLRKRPQRRAAESIALAGRQSGRDRLSCDSHTRKCMHPKPSSVESNPVRVCRQRYVIAESHGGNRLLHRARNIAALERHCGGLFISRNKAVIFSCTFYFYFLPLPEARVIDSAQVRRV